MGVFSSGISNAEIDAAVAKHFEEYLGRPDKVGDGQFAENFESMVDSLKRWADSNSLNLWKRSRICGDIESSLRSNLTGDIAAELTGKARSVICA